MNLPVNKGFLVLADITGFTPFVATTELEHSQEILQNMLKVIISFLTPTFRLAEVEGDAVFVYTDKMPRQEMILEIIDSVYFNFRDRKASYKRMRTCHCKACEMASTLDLKFVVHYGEYIMNNAGGKNKPLGASVNVAHRLLKNHVVEATGWTAYALFTKDCLEAVQSYPDHLHELVEEYDHIGKVQTFSINLDEQYKNYLAERTVYLSAEDADLVVFKDFPAPPSQLWEWSNDPKKRSQWAIGSDWKVRERPNASSRRGASNHCVNSKVIEKILDYRPFNYYSSSMGRGPLNFTLTVKYDETDSGTRLYWHVKMDGILPKFIRRMVCKLIVLNGMQIHVAFNKLYQLVEEEKLANQVIA